MRSHQGQGISRLLSYEYLFPLLTVPFLVVLGQTHFLIFHVAAEGFASVVGVVMFFIAATTFRWTRNHFYFWLGAGYFWIAAADILHTFAYKGMGLLGDGTANPATQYWIATRFLEALVLLLSPLFLRRTLRPLPTFVGFGLVVLALHAAILTGRFPDAYVEGVGLTPFKVATEYAIIGVLALSWLHLRQYRDHLPEGSFLPLTIVVVLTACAELAFTFYVSVYGLSNMVGHIFKFVSFWMLLVLTVRTVLTMPFVMLGRDSRTLDGVPLPTLLVDRDARIITTNPAAERFLGRRAARLVGGDLHAVADLDVPPKAACPVCMALRAGEKLQGFETRHAPTGRWVEVSVTPVTSEEHPDAAVVVLHDLTERREAEKAIEEARERMALALENTDQGLWDWNIETGAVMFSDRIMTMLGYAPEDWEPHVEAWERRVHPDDRAKVEAALRAHLDGRTDRYDCTHRVRRADGTWAWISDRGKVVERDADGRPVRAIGTHIDVTEEVRLRERLEDNIAALQEAQAKLRDSNEHYQQFAHIISHDLREPLRMVSSYLTLLERRMGAELSEEAQEFIGYAVDGARRMTQMIDGLLEYSRVQTKGEAFEPQPSETILDAALENLAVAIADAGAEVRKEGRFPEVQCDRPQVLRLFQNLVANAVKFHAPGVSPVITVRVVPGQAFHTFEVSDNGIGIPDDALDEVFQPFRRLHAAWEYEGTGMGLAICKRIVERHGGTISAARNAAGGTTVTFTLPNVSRKGDAAQTPRVKAETV